MSEDNKMDIDYSDAEQPVDHTLLPIDYTLTEQPAESPAGSDWEPPKHVYFGKKLPNGKLAPEPVYVYQEYPRMMYGLIDGRIRARICNNDQEKAALVAAGYKKGPGEWGMETAPSRETSHARAIVAEKKAEETVTETVTIVKRPRGRPPGSKNKAQ